MGACPLRTLFDQDLSRVFGAQAQTVGSGERIQATETGSSKRWSTPPRPSGSSYRICSEYPDNVGNVRDLGRQTRRVSGLFSSVGRLLYCESDLLARVVCRDSITVAALARSDSRQMKGTRSWLTI